MKSELNYYKKRGCKTVDDWMSPLTMKAIIQFSKIQESEAILGSVCEIGVHHGRLIILLHLLTNGEEKSAVWDLFENQDENLLESGKGDLQSFKENLERFGCDLGSIRIQTKNSLNLDAKEVIETCDGRPRLFSIDGGHTDNITFNDIQIAAESICGKGIIILDDFFNELWPGVSEGV